MTADSFWIDRQVLILPSSQASTKQTRLGLFRQYFYESLCSIYNPLFYFLLLFFFPYLLSSPSSSTSSEWIIHWVIHNLGEAARDLHSSLCHWVLFGGIFNNCLIYQIDWELGARVLRASVPDMSDYGRGDCLFFFHQQQPQRNCHRNFLLTSNSHYSSSFSYWLKCFFEYLAA